MTLRCVTCLLALVAVGHQFSAMAPADTGKQTDELESKLASALAENKMLKKLVADLNDLNSQINAELAAERRAAEETRKKIVKTRNEHQVRATDYKLALAENKMLKARIKSLIRSGRSGASKSAAGTRDRRNVRLIAITLHEELWKWWTDPQLLTDHIALRRKLVHLDADHSIDAWLTRRKEFAGTKVNWPMKLVSGSIMSKSKVDEARKKADQDLTDTLNAVVYGKSRPKVPDDSRVVDRRIKARATTRPKAGRPDRKKETKARRNTGPAVMSRADLRKRVSQLQERIELYKRASASGGLTTIYAVAGNIAVEMSLPGRRFEKVRMTDRPGVQIVGKILSAAPKAGFFAGRKDSMIQFVVSGECKMGDQPAPGPKSE